MDSPSEVPTYDVPAIVQILGRTNGLIAACNLAVISTTETAVVDKPAKAEEHDHHGHAH